MFCIAGMRHIRFISTRAVVSMSWISSSARLPHVGTSIQFMLDDRDVPMKGTYAEGVFRSRWGNYDVGCVRLWRAWDLDPSAAAAAMPA
jgi:hypothetical protein